MINMLYMLFNGTHIRNFSEVTAVNPGYRWEINVIFIIDKDVHFIVWPNIESNFHLLLEELFYF